MSKQSIFRRSMLIAVFAFGTAATSIGHASDHPIASYSGKKVNFTLLDIGTCIVTLPLCATQSAGAPHAYVFYFLLERRNKEESGYPTLHRDFDFFVDGKTYTASTKADLDKEFEALIVAEDVGEFRSEIRPDLASVIRANDEDAIIIYIIVPGIKLKRGTPISAKYFVGWDSEFEEFNITTKLP